MALTPGDVSEIVAAVKENWRKIGACPQHYFENTIVFGGKNTCLKCGGVVDNRYLGAYIAGYVAGGGNANDIKPGYKLDA